jgi:actin-like ATPase involved in cell morphogenesis
VIADFDTVEMMLHYFIRKVHLQRMMAPHPRVVIGIPSGVTEVEKRAAKDAALSAGAREAYPLEEEIRVTLCGRDLLTGLPKAVEVSSVELRDATPTPVNTIVELVEAAIEETPPEGVAAD